MSVELSEEIHRRFGNVRRARGCYLYTEKGVRLTDCCLDGGRAILGWDGGKARTVFKDTLERGATGSYCGNYDSRLVTSVRHLLPEAYGEIRWYYREPSLQEKPVLWRPWLDITATVTPTVTGYPEVTPVFPCVEEGKDLPAVIKLVPPYPWATTLCIYAFRGTVDGVPASDVIPAPYAAALARAFCDLKTALGIFGEEDFKCFSRQLTPFFERKGCWLFPKMPREEYDGFVLACLDSGIVISPDYDEPSIIPWRANKGDIKKIALAGGKINQ